MLTTHSYTFSTVAQVTHHGCRHQQDDDRVLQVAPQKPEESLLGDLLEAVRPKDEGSHFQRGAAHRPSIEAIHCARPQNVGNASDAAPFPESSIVLLLWHITS